MLSRPLRIALIRPHAAPLATSGSIDAGGPNIDNHPVTPRDAIEAFCLTPLDAPAIGSFLVEQAP